MLGGAAPLPTVIGQNSLAAAVSPERAGRVTRLSAVTPDLMDRVASWLADNAGGPVTVPCQH